MMNIKVDPNIPPDQMVLKSKSSRLLVRNIGGNDLDSRTKTIMKELPSGLLWPVDDCDMYDVLWNELNQKHAQDTVEFFITEKVTFGVANTRAVKRIQMKEPEVKTIGGMGLE